MELMAFPLWIRLAHVFDILFLSLLVRSGLEILGAHPKLYWNDHCTPGSEWLRLTRKRMPADQLWTSMDEEQAMHPVIALPGGRRPGLGRHWHFASVLGWIATGAVYVVLLVFTSEWHRLIPTTPAAVPEAWSELVTYLHFQLPPPGHPYTALQQFAYAPVVFLLAPLTIATGIAMSPAVAARFRWYPRLFGGKQAARSLHFLCLLGFAAFTALHTLMVVVHGLGQELAMMLLGSERASPFLALVAGAILLAVIAGIHVFATIASRRRPRGVQVLLGHLVDPVQRLLAKRLAPSQMLSEKDITPAFRVNGYPPAGDDYLELARGGFRDWRLQLGGLVARPRSLSLEDLRAMPRQEQITKHTCIQGWTGVARWAGVPLAALIEMAGPKQLARYVLVTGLDDKTFSAAEGEHGCGHFYEVLDLELATQAQTILAYEMNGEPLPVEHGAPLRLRVESQLGFKMVKWIASIELIEDYSQIGGGQGGWREDNMFYSRVVAI